MKKYSMATIIAILVIMLFASPAAAVGPTGSWVSGITCQNLSDTLANVTFNFYRVGESTPALTYNDTIPANGTLKYFTPNTPVGLPSNFIGSAAVSSTEQLACNVNTQSTGTGTTTAPYRIGTSLGFNTPYVGPEMYVPQITKAGTWNTYIAVQNTTNGSVDIKVQYYDKNTGDEIASALENLTIAANSSVVIYPEANANLPTTFYGSAKISSVDPADTPLAAVVNFHNGGSDYTTSQFQSYNAFASGASTLYAPRVVRKYYGYNSGISIQNISDVATTLDVEMSFADGSQISYTTPSISPNASYIAYLPNITDLAPVDAYNMTKRYASVKVIANDPSAMIVGITNIDNRGLASDNNGMPVPAENIGKGATANMALGGTATTTVFFSQVARKVSGFSGGIIIANAETGEGTCDIYFSGEPGATLYDVVLPDQGQISFFLGTYTDLPTGFNASVKAECTKAVYGTYNFSIEPGYGKYGDSYIEANGLNQ